MARMLVELCQGRKPMHKARILLIEDTDSVREVLTRQLEVLGVLVTALADGDNVKRELDKTDYDLVIADLHLPNISGFDIARFANAKNCKVVLLSGDTQAATRDDFLTAQFDQILTKPVTIQTLKNMLVTHDLISDDEPVVANSNDDLAGDDLAAINLHALKEQMGHLDDVALQMLARFPDMMRPLAYKILDASTRQDTKQIVDIAHSLKGAARSAGALTLGMIAEKTQELASGKIIDKAQIDTLLAEFTRVEVEIKKMCQSKAAIS
jgi:CheY-like chemotaxis protein